MWSSVRRMVRILDGRVVGLAVDGVGTSLVCNLGGGADVVHVETVAFAGKAGSATVIALLVISSLGPLPARQFRDGSRDRSAMTSAAFFGGHRCAQARTLRNRREGSSNRCLAL